jgi:hypothetical protein
VGVLLLDQAAEDDGEGPAAAASAAAAVAVAECVVTLHAAQLDVLMVESV